MSNDNINKKDWKIEAFISNDLLRCSFSEESLLGEGGEGPVYYGVLVSNGQEIAIAIKVIQKSNKNFFF